MYCNERRKIKMDNENLKTTNFEIKAETQTETKPAPQMETQTETQPTPAPKKDATIFTVKNVLAAILVIIVLLGFLPICVISAMGISYGISIYTLTFGNAALEMLGVEGEPTNLIFWAFPIASLVCLFINKIKNKNKGLIIMILSVLEFIAFASYGAYINQEMDGWISINLSFWHYLHLVLLIVVIVMGFMIFRAKLALSKDLTDKVASESTKEALKNISNSTVNIAGNASESLKKMVDNISEKPQHCQQCGERLAKGSKFCMKCGAKVEEIKPEPTANFCQQCGEKLDGAAEFCENCGTKIEK